jgi:uncharacterized metal-binding protein YceD (DUF177 family)
MTIEADADQRAAIAKRLGFEALDRLVATLTLVMAGEDVVANGRLEADVVQACVATGRPMPTTINEPLEVRFTPLAALEVAEAEAEVELDAEALDVIPYTGDRIDIGAMIADSLALVLDPYPRSADADEFLKAQGVLGEDEVGVFSGLAALKAQLEGKA